jgi:hypothetical protein
MSLKSIKRRFNFFDKLVLILSSGRQAAGPPTSQNDKIRKFSESGLSFNISLK